MQYFHQICEVFSYSSSNLSIWMFYQWFKKYSIGLLQLFLSYKIAHSYSVKMHAYLGSLNRSNTYDRYISPVCKFFFYYVNNLNLEHYPAPIISVVVRPAQRQINMALINKAMSKRSLAIYLYIIHKEPNQHWFQGMFFQYNKYVCVECNENTWRLSGVKGIQVQ